MLWPKSIHLKAARQALRTKLDGKMVPDRLVKFIGEDNSYLKQFICPLPFEHFEIGPCRRRAGLLRPLAANQHRQYSQRSRRRNFLNRTPHEKSVNR